MVAKTKSTHHHCTPPYLYLLQDKVCQSKLLLHSCFPHHTDFSNISETEQNFTETDENTSVQDSPNLNFTDEDINESENSNGIKEESLDFGLDLDFDSNVESTDDSQLGIF